MATASLVSHACDRSKSSVYVRPRSCQTSTRPTSSNILILFWTRCCRHVFWMHHTHVSSAGWHSSRNAQRHACQNRANYTLSQNLLAKDLCMTSLTSTKGRSKRTHAGNWPFRCFSGRQFAVVNFSLYPPNTMAYVQTVLGLQHMHNKGILHRDIKSLNLLLEADRNVKIADLGIATVGT